MTTIWDEITEELPELQRQAEGGMIETCRIDRVLGVGSDDDGFPEVTLQDPPIYIGPFKLRSFRPHESEREVIGTTSTSQRLDLHIPASERMPELVELEVVEVWNGPVHAGDFLTRNTPGRIEEVYRIAVEHSVTWQTAQRLVGDYQTGGITA